MDGFTVKQAEALRSMHSMRSSVAKEDVDFEKCASASADMIAALLGASIGGKLGLVSDAIRPADDDEDRNRRRLMALLSGAALGGIAGYGARRFMDSSPSLFGGKPSVPSRVMEAVDPDVSTVLAAGGLGWGASPAFSRGGGIAGLYTRGARDFSGLHLDKAFREDVANRGVMDALSRYDAIAGGGKRLALRRLMDTFMPNKGPFRSLQAEEGLAAQNLVSELGKSTAFKDKLKGMGIDLAKVTNENAGGISHNIARSARRFSPKGRAARALALLIGGGAALYKGYDMTH